MLACGEYDLTAALRTGEVESEGVNRSVVNYPFPERHWCILRHLEFDICERSMESYLSSSSRTEEYPFTALTAIPHRSFRHSYRFKHSVADGEDPGDRHAKKVGLRTWQTTADILGARPRPEAGDLMHRRAGGPWAFHLRPVRRWSVSDSRNLKEMLIAGDRTGAMYPALLDSVEQKDDGAEYTFDLSLAVEQ